MSPIRKALMLLAVVLKNPIEFVDRLEAIIEVQADKRWSQKPNHVPQHLDDCQIILEESLGSIPDEKDVVEHLAEQIQERIGLLEKQAPFTLAHNADPTLARLCYAVCRVLKPRHVVETGVAYGVTTSFVLQALTLNQQGTLYSIDLPPLGKNADAFAGILVPEELRFRWQLYRGTSKRVLPEVLPQLGRVDVFIHDSLHTYRNVMRELEIVFPLLARPSVVLVDDVDGNRAFSDWVERVTPSFWAVIREQEKNSAFGLAIFR